MYRKSQLNEDNQQHMLLKQRVLADIVEGRIRLAFRRWKRPTVKAGGSLRTVVGVLAVEAVDLVTEAKITKQEASHAGYSSREELLAELQTRTEGKLYRIALRFAGADPRHELRQQDDLSKQEIVDVKSRLNRMDVRSRQGLWTTTTLKLIATNPGKLAADLFLTRYVLSKQQSLALMDANSETYGGHLKIHWRVDLHPVAVAVKILLGGNVDRDTLTFNCFARSTKTPTSSQLIVSVESIGEQDVQTTLDLRESGLGKPYSFSKEKSNDRSPLLCYSSR